MKKIALLLASILTGVCLVSAGAEGARVPLTAGGRTFTLQLEDSAAASAFARRLPMTLVMEELNGNEKYHYMLDAIPSESVDVGWINAGDVMLFGDRCVVVFYESFATTWPYTRLGRITDPAGLREALGPGTVTVTFGD